MKRRCLPVFRAASSALNADFGGCFPRFLRPTNAPFSTTLANEPASTPIEPATHIEEGPPKTHVSHLCEEIAALSLSDAHCLVRLLKKKLGVSDATLHPSVVSAASISSSNAATASEQNPFASALASESAPTKVEFSVVLTAFDATSKARLIKEIKGVMPDMTLIQAKNFVESAPKLVKERLTKEDAESLKRALEAAGGTVKVE